MSTERNKASQQAMASDKQLAENYYGIALPGMEERFRAINTGLAEGGEPEYMKSAFAAQRAGITEGMVQKDRLGLAQGAMRSKAAVAGGNAFAGMSNSQMGAQLANALYGSKFQQGQSALDESFNLMSMGLGGSGTAGSGALDSAGNQLSMLGYMPNYNKTYANILGATSALSSVYGAFNQPQGDPSQWQGRQYNQTGVLTNFGAQ